MNIEPLNDRARSMLSRSGIRLARLDRRPAPHRLVLRALPRVLQARFDARAATGLQAVFELRVSDPGGEPPSRFQLLVSESSCQVTPGPASSPGATATLGADDMIRLVSGSVGWPGLVSSGRLELTGDPFLAVRFPSLFRLPVSARTANGSPQTSVD